MEPTIFTIFGATGDLTHRKVIPALYRLYSKGNLSHEFAIVACARREKSNDDFRKDAFDSLKKNVNDLDIKKAEEMLAFLYYHKTDFDNESNYKGLKDFLDELDIQHMTKGNRVFYLATLPDHFEPITTNLQKYGFLARQDNRKYRIIIEKPFGTDLESATKLNKIVTKAFTEDEIYRIDHYLGKETVQNLLALRFANGIFMPLWNSDNIDNVQITVSETLGVGTRAGFYDKYGALKDIVQNHILQILALVAMEAPSSFSEEALKDKKVQVLKNVKAKDIVFAQYAHGTNPAYIEEPNVNPESKTETFSAIRLYIDNTRWRGTPFYVRTGKCMKEKLSEVAVYFKPTKVNIFNQEIKQNVLIAKLQPDESINWRFNAKMPGNDFKIDRVSMDFCYDCLFDINTPEAYEKLLHDVFNGDSMLFTRWDEVQASWRIIDPIAKYMKENPDKLLYYPAGNWGPRQADEILTKNGHHWRLRDGKA